MAFDEFGLDDTLKLGADKLRVDYSLVMSLAELGGATIRSTLSTRLEVRDALIGGSLVRQTWGAPHRELDLFVVLDDVHRDYLASPPAVLMQEIAATLRHRHSFVRHNDGGRIVVRDGGQPNRWDRMPDIVVLPALVEGRALVVPDRWRNAWIRIDPRHLEASARAADQKRANWRELTRIVKTWNNRDGKFEPFIRPGLLIEVMVMEIAASEALGPDLGTQLAALFQLLFRRIDEDWPDPAGLAPPLNSTMSRGRRNFARQHLEHTWLTLAQAKRADAGGNVREAKQLARSVLRKMVSIAPRDEYGELLPVRGLWNSR